MLVWLNVANYDLERYYEMNTHIKDLLICLMNARKKEAIDEEEEDEEEEAKPHS